MPEDSTGYKRYGIFEYYEWERAHPCLAYADSLALNHSTYKSDRAKEEATRLRRFEKIRKEVAKEEAKRQTLESLK